MKTQAFVAIENPKPNRGKYSFDVYRCTSEGLEFIASSSMNYGSTRGQESEAWRVLAENGIVPMRTYAKHKYFNKGELPKKYQSFRISYKVHAK